MTVGLREEMKGGTLRLSAPVLMKSGLHGTYSLHHRTSVLVLSHVSGRNITLSRAEEIDTASISISTHIPLHQVLSIALIINLE